MPPRPPIPISTQILHRGEGLAVAEIGPICAVIWRDEVTRERFDIQRNALDQVVRRHKNDAAFLCVVESDVKPPSDELRKASSEMLASHQGVLRCMAGVIEGDGFKAALTRSVLSGITLLIRNRQSPVSYFATVEQATRWLSDQIAVDAKALQSSVEHLRSQLPSKLHYVPAP